MKKSVTICMLSVVFGAMSVGVFAQDDAAEGGETNAEEVVAATTDQVVEDVSSAARQVAEGDFSAVFPLIEKYVFPVISALLILIVAYFAARLLARLVKQPIQERVDKTLGTFVGKLTFYSIMLFALLGVLGKFGISVASFAAVVASAGFAIGLAFQGTLSNFAAGVLLLVFRPYKVGDVITAAGITAKVTEIDLFTTVFDTPDNRRFIVPNSAIAGDTIENITYHSERRADVAVGVAYSADVDKTREVLTAAAETLKDKLVEGDGRGYQVALIDLGDSSVNWAVRFWTRSEDFWPVKQNLTVAVKHHLEEAGINIPFPQMDVHLVKDSL